MIDAILQLMPLDADYCEHPVEYMVPDKDAGITIERPKVWTTRSQRWRKRLQRQTGRRDRADKFMKSRKAYVTVCTSERQPYGCFIMQKGVL